jgi:hypothetical protein
MSHEIGTIIIDVQHNINRFFSACLSDSWLTSYLKIMHPVSAAICYDGERKKKMKINFSILQKICFYAGILFIEF